MGSINHNQSASFLLSQRNDLISIGLTCLPNKCSQEGIRIPDQIQWCVVFLNFSMVQHQNLVIVNNRIQSVCDRYHCCLNSH